jgi:hypothetical protein
MSAHVRRLAVAATSPSGRHHIAVALVLAVVCLLAWSMSGMLGPVGSP